MKQIKSLGLVLVFIAIILVFVVFRISNQNLFRQDATNAIEAAQNNNNSISISEFENHPADFLLVDLTKTEAYKASPYKNSIHIPFEKLIEKPSAKILKETDLKLVLYSEDVASASKAWIILNQLNFKNVYILQKDENEEVLKYKFQPDTTARLE